MPLPSSAVAAQAATTISFLVIGRSLSVRYLRLCWQVPTGATCRRRQLMFFGPLTKNNRPFGIDNPAASGFSPSFRIQ
jgi:hypothetical protein